ncbi:MAG: hypothetical protein GXP55_05785 [Deltaproteobacteria bacterium]|nr:hypothetical protein [Deltaproteobacteria bacterium]
MRYVLYILFGLTVLGGYVFVNVRGIEPFSASTEVRDMPTGTPGRPGAGTGRGPRSLFWYGGFHGGK